MIGTLNHPKIMKVNGVGCILNSPLAVPVKKDKDGNDIPSCLPPYKEVMPYSVDDFPACPTNWMHGSSLASSYFLAVEEGKGLWLDFNPCQEHTHHIAVVISVQGVNPISGQKQDKMRLEQYRNKCPIHNCDFQQDRFCPECKYKWPPQNYLATTGTPVGWFWLDGFRTAEGQVRQYILTAEEIKGVAAQIIGDQRVFAIGVAFYKSKLPKPLPPMKPTPEPAPVLLRDMTKIGTKGFYTQQMSYSPLHTPVNWNVGLKGGGGTCSSASIDNTYNTDRDCYIASNATPKYGSANENVYKEVIGASPDSLALDDEDEDETVASAAVVSRRGDVPDDIKPVKAKKLEVGAGGAISQQVDMDPENPEFWDDSPIGMIYINYAPKETIDKILAAGKREEKKEGFLTELNITK